MKKDKIIFWVSTAIVAGMMLMSGGMYLTKNPDIVNGLHALGFPPYMLYILGVSKLLAGGALLQPLFPGLREWAYAGLTFTFIGAVISHIATSTPFVAPIVFLAVLAVSWAYNQRLAQAK
jgi:hypothetical protein